MSLQRKQSLHHWGHLPCNIALCQTEEAENIQLTHGLALNWMLVCSLRLFPTLSLQFIAEWDFESQ